VTEALTPPPPPPAPSLEDGFHGPRTSFFPGIGRQLTILEQSSRSGGVAGVKRGLAVAFIVAGVIGLLASLAVQWALLSVVGFQVIAVLLAPLTEEPSKALGVVVVALFVWKAVPNRRYGAALGAAAGLGFGVVESIIYIINITSASLPAELEGARAGLVLMRVVVTPLMHPLWSAFMGIGIFAVLAKKSLPENSPTSPALPLLFIIIGIANHIVWNAISVFSGLGYVAVATNAMVIFPLFAIILRDFLGGHFNFPNFFESLQESPSPAEAFVPPPPPP